MQTWIIIFLLSLLSACIAGFMTFVLVKDNEENTNKYPKAMLIGVIISIVSVIGYQMLSETSLENIISGEQDIMTGAPDF